MSKNTKPTHTVKLTKSHLKLITEYVEVVHRAICGQYKPLFDLLTEKHNIKIDYYDKIDLENFLKSKFQPELEPNASYSGDFDKLGYQTYRDILEYFEEVKNTPDGFFKSVYSHKMDQIADEPKLQIFKN